MSLQFFKLTLFTLFSLNATRIMIHHKSHIEMPKKRYQYNNYDDLHVASPQTVKFVNNSNVELSYQHTIPADSIAYIHMVSTVYPCAYLTSIYPFNSATPYEKKLKTTPLGAFVRIKFDRVVNQSFIDEFFEVLKGIHLIFKHLRPVRLGDEFVIAIRTGYTAKEINLFIEKANIAIYKKKLMEISGNINNN